MVCRQHCSQARSGEPLGEFGNQFRQARESKNLSFDDVSNVTKITSRMLQAIEDEHFDQLPGGVFNRGFIRAYAKHLGLNPDEAVNGYLACLRQAQIDSQQVWQTESLPVPEHPPAAVEIAPAPAKPVAKPQAPVQVEELPDLQLPRAEHVRQRRREYDGPPRAAISWKLIAFAIAVLVAVVILWNRHSRNQRGKVEQAPAPATSTRSAPIVASAQAASPTQTSVATPGAAPVRPSSNTTQTLKPPASTKPTAAPPTTPAAKAEEQVVEKGDVTIRSFGQPVAKPADQPAASLSLVIRATETSWISVTSDGQLVRQETLIAPANTTVHASREIIARIGNAAGITFLWNGEDVPAQGAESEVKTLVFDAQGMHTIASTNTPNQN